MTTAGSAVFLALLLSSGVALGEVPVSFNLCGTQAPTFQACGPDSPKCRQPLAELRVRCPGVTAPVLVFAGCKGPRVQRTGQAYTVSCASWQDTAIVIKGP